jgi:hypothetical protein
MRSDQETAFIAVLFLLATLAVVATLGIIRNGGISTKTSQELNREIHGRWIEVGVPKHVAEIFEVSVEGVRRNGRLISTKFEYDGKYFTFSTGSGVHKFLIDREDVEEGLAPRLFLSQRSDSYYNQTYRKI